MRICTEFAYNFRGIHLITEQNPERREDLKNVNFRVNLFLGKLEFTNSLLTCVALYDF